MPPKEQRLARVCLGSRRRFQRRDEEWRRIGLLFNCTWTARIFRCRRVGTPAGYRGCREGPRARLPDVRMAMTHGQRSRADALVSSGRSRRSTVLHVVRQTLRSGRGEGCVTNRSNQTQPDCMPLPQSLMAFTNKRRECYQR